MTPSDYLAYSIHLTIQAILAGEIAQVWVRKPLCLVPLLGARRPTLLWTER